MRENRFRRMAKRHGMTLEKCRRRDPEALGYGTYRLVRQRDNYPLWYNEYGGGFGVKMEEIEAILSDQVLMEKSALVMKECP